MLPASGCVHSYNLPNLPCFHWWWLTEQNVSNVRQEYVETSWIHMLPISHFLVGNIPIVQEGEKWRCIADMLQRVIDGFDRCVELIVRVFSIEYRR